MDPLDPNEEVVEETLDPNEVDYSEEDDEEVE